MLQRKIVIVFSVSSMFVLVSSFYKPIFPPNLSLAPPKVPFLPTPLQYSTRFTVGLSANQSSWPAVIWPFWFNTGQWKSARWYSERGLISATSVPVLYEQSHRGLVKHWHYVVILCNAWTTLIVVKGLKSSPWRVCVFILAISSVL